MRDTGEMASEPPSCKRTVSPRVCARTVKSPLSRWNARPDGKPRTTRQIASIATDIDPRHYKPPKPRLTLIDKLRQAAERGEPLDDLLKRLTSLHCC
jgi:hypothetical protein